MILTPREIEQWIAKGRQRGWLDIVHLPTADVGVEELCDTLAAYAEVVRGVAEGRVKRAKWCIGEHIDHVDIDEETYLLARKLRGLE